MSPTDCRVIVAIHGQLRHAVESIAIELDLDTGKFTQSLRSAIIGRAVSPGIEETAMPVGKKLTSHRIDKALAYIAEREGG